MKKIKIIFYSHSIDFAGTWRSHERILENIDKNIFEPYVLYNENIENNRLSFVKKILGDNYVLPFHTLGNKTNAESGYKFINTNFDDVVNNIQPDIIHFARSGYYEWPFDKRICPIQIETNIFAGIDNSPFIDYTIAICETIHNARGKSDCVIYNPIPTPLIGEENLKKELNIKKRTFVLGRIGRASNFTPIALEACKLLKGKNFDFIYIIISPCEETKNFVYKNNLNDNVIFYEPTNNDLFIDKFYKTLDVFAHYRSDGECHSTSISQAMAYGIPIISHYAGFNGQVETISNGGFVCGTHIEYADKIIKIYEDKNLRNKLSENALLKFEEFSYRTTIPKFEKVYLNLYNNLINKK